MKTLLVGVAGHVDHGKTALVKALTGIDTDRLKEERARGISIVLGFAHLQLPEGEIDLIDMPGHERFVRTMISGASGTDALLLVVAANEGPRRQTVEHLQIASLLGLRRCAVAISKCDLVQPADAERVAAQTTELVAATGLEAGRPVLCSAATGQGLDELMAALHELVASAAGTRPAGPAYLPIDRVFSVAGFGTVITGTLRRGALAVGAEVEIVPGGERVRIRGLQIHGRAVDRADPGRRVAVNLRGIEHGRIEPGKALAYPGLVGLGAWLDVDAALLADAPQPLANGAALRLLFGTAETAARVRLLDRHLFEPGSRALLQLHCEQPIAVPAGERFILRMPSPPRTIGGGRVVDPLSRRRRRFEPRIVTRLQRLAEARPVEAMALLLEEHEARGVPLAELARHLGAAAEEIRVWCRNGGATICRNGTVIGDKALAVIEHRLIMALESCHRLHRDRAGMTREELHRLFAGGPAPAAVNDIIARLVERGELATTGGLVHRKSFMPPVADAAAAQALERKLADVVRTGGLTPPDWEQIAGADLARRRAFERLVRSRVLVRLVDRVQKRTLLFHKDAVERAAVLLRDALAVRPDGLRAHEAGAVLGVSRKFSIPLLEHFDRVGLTRRHGDLRRLAARSSPSAGAPSELQDLSGAGRHVAACSQAVEGFHEGRRRDDARGRTRGS